MNYEIVFCIVNNGFSDVVMDAAKEYGAKGGTVLHARGTANKKAEKIFNITVQPEKEIVMILIPSDIKDNILHAIYKQVGLKTPGQGIAFTLPVDDVVGLTENDIKENTKSWFSAFLFYAIILKKWKGFKKTYG